MLELYPASRAHARPSALDRVTKARRWGVCRGRHLTQRHREAQRSGRCVTRSPLIWTAPSELERAPCLRALVASSCMVHTQRLRRDALSLSSVPRTSTRLSAIMAPTCVSCDRTGLPHRPPTIVSGEQVNEWWPGPAIGRWPNRSGEHLGRDLTGQFAAPPPAPTVSRFVDP